jgi:hypothetical protein
VIPGSGFSLYPHADLPRGADREKQLLTDVNPCRLFGLNEQSMGSFFSLTFVLLDEN